MAHNVMMAYCWRRKRDIVLLTFVLPLLYTICWMNVAGSTKETLSKDGAGLAYIANKTTSNTPGVAPLSDMSDTQNGPVIQTEHVTVPSNLSAVANMAKSADVGTPSSEPAPIIIINIMPWYKRWHNHSQKYWYKEGLGPQVFSSCPEPRCQLVNNLSQADAVLISHKFIWPTAQRWIEQFTLPPMRTPNQKWVFVSNEPPQYRPVAPQYTDLFNVTFTYRSDSDARYPYGHVIKRRSPWNGPENSSSSWRYDPHWNTKGQVVWVVSNCHALSKREHYVHELSKYINITIYGECGERMKCKRSEKNLYNLSCYSSIEQNFKFYLAFENSLCKEYASEKFWRALQQQMIPVVYGMYDYKHNAPNNSYIDVRDFNSPRELAEHLKKVAADRALYESYMAWKENYAVVTDPFYEATCELCAHLHKTIHDPPKTVQLADYWGAETNCISPKPFLQDLGVTV